MGLKVLNPLIKTVAKKAYVAPKMEVRILEPLGLKMEQLTGDVVNISKRIFQKPSAEKLNILLKEQGLSTKHICDNNSLFLEELITRFPIKSGEKTNLALEDIMIYLEDINHAKYADKLSFLDDFLNNVKKVEKMTDVEGKLLYNSANKLYTKKAILQAQYNNPERYEDIMNLYKLHKEGKAPKYVLQTLFPESTFHHLLKSDMQKLLRGENYYPQLESLSENLISKLETGEAFSVGKDMFVKTAQGYEKLKIDVQTYEKLFPPIERYALAQGPLGNCHLMATMDSIIKNPEGRIEFYKMFEQTKNGVKCTIAGYKDGGIVYNFVDLAQLYGENNLRGSLGHKMIEYTYAKNKYDTIVQLANEGSYRSELFLETHKTPVEVFNTGGDYEDVQKHILKLIGKESDCLDFSKYSSFQTFRGPSVVNVNGFTDNYNIGLINGHFYNANLASKTIVNPWNTLLEIHHSPFELSEIVHVI